MSDTRTYFTTACDALRFLKKAPTMAVEDPAIITLPQMREQLYSAVVSDALDGLGYSNQSPRVPLPPITVDTTLVGRAKTTLWADMAHEDPQPYELELQAVDSCQPDDVFVAAAGGSWRSGVWGELLSTAASNSGCVGAIIDGAVRDVVKMRAMQFPVFARGTCVYDSMHRQRVIDIDVPVQIDRVRICPGDLIFADEDGVVVVPQAVEQEAIRAAWDKVHAENITRDAIKNGMKAVDAYAKYGVL
ncbi:RraA family protein [Symmachiella dynata]|uniref:RraA family protein n=1 Tax=Symmachiella dynata TaxID=2527995 RepID=UPI0030EC1D9A|tara:strand:+ start:484 stop:1221 length:738 start_codon:yes stop_codon:yes gene_type:complete